MYKGQNQMKYCDINTNQRNSTLIAVLHLGSCCKVFNTTSYSPIPYSKDEKASVKQHKDH